VRRDDEQHVAELTVKIDSLKQGHKSAHSVSRKGASRAQILAKIDELKSRRSFLIDNYPSHTDIPVLAKQIKDLRAQLDKSSDRASAKAAPSGREINEAIVHRDYFLRRLKNAQLEEHTVRPRWEILRTKNQPWPSRIEEWPLGAGVTIG